MPAHKMPDMNARPPQDFASVLATDGTLFLVGGQAVNLWALYYIGRTSDLSPFVSRDLDVLGDRETLRKIARIAGVKPQFFPMRPPSNEVGVIIAKGIDGQPLAVEVLSHLHGITNEKLCHPDYTIGIGEGGVLVRVPGPISLLQAKIANAADLVQAGRQDNRHVLILAKLMPAYLADIQASVTEGRSNERDMISLLEHLLSTVSSPKARRVLKDLRICALTMFSELKVMPSSKLHSFMTKRLKRILP
ncbi:MAG TPA: hypothetical protein DET40_06040 [Lentisphaeria bacterium]|nr:MAG: hypothetical protein A2X45_04545 [Lentisphaerae bacterium GWF2_50_93]HCE43087.1 hypothetical protein [Lentisphaeria bacterium]